MFIHRKTDLSARFIGEMTDTVLPSGKLLCVDTDTALWDVSSGKLLCVDTDTALWDVPSGKLLCVDTDTALWDVPSGKLLCGVLTPVGKRSVHVFMRQKKKKRKKSIRFIFAGYKQPSQ